MTQHCHWNTEAPVGIHFRGQGNTVCDLEIIPFEKVRQNNPMLRNVLESFYINNFLAVKKLGRTLGKDQFGSNKGMLIAIFVQICFIVIFHFRVTHSKKHTKMMP